MAPYFPPVRGATSKKRPTLLDLWSKEDEAGVASAATSPRLKHIRAAAVEPQQLAVKPPTWWWPAGATEGSQLSASVAREKLIATAARRSAAEGEVRWRTHARFGTTAGAAATARMLRVPTSPGPSAAMRASERDASALAELEPADGYAPYVETLTAQQIAESKKRW
eukprot:COSAG06_NODE_3383_length_5424_cov_4.593518_5_plen_166_part_01